MISCRRCPRLVTWRETSAANPPKRHRGETYWGKPIPGFGDPEARLLVVGLAPAANGGNRTGRIFTGDSSGDTLFAALYASGFANQALSVSRDDGLELHDCYITASARCAPPDNRPTPAEFATCRPFLVHEVAALTRLRVIVALGALAWDQLRLAFPPVGRAVAFSHGGEASLPDGKLLLGSYHPSRQNTNTGRLTPEMLLSVFQKAREAITKE